MLGSAGQESRSSEAVSERWPDARVFDMDGARWSVREDRSPLNGPCLIFENQKIARRVREYPLNWRELADEDLCALSTSR